jgi:hypothetical protein
MLRKLLGVALALLAGCATVRPPPRVQPVSGETIQTAQLAGHLNALQVLVQGSPAEQAEALAAARAAYEQARQGPAALRYALMLAAPRHPAHDALQAQRLLQEALARPELFSPVERALAMVELARVDGELGLAAENARLVAEARAERERVRTTGTSPVPSRRLKEEMEENVRLRKALDEARAKLDAITKIERNSITDRPNASEASKP